MPFHWGTQGRIARAGETGVDGELSLALRRKSIPVGEMVILKFSMASIARCLAFLKSGSQLLRISSDGGFSGVKELRKAPLILSPSQSLGDGVLIGEIKRSRPRMGEAKVRGKRRTAEATSWKSLVDTMVEMF